MTKPGWKTTEFWKALITNIIGLAIVFGWIPMEHGDDMIQAATLVAGSLISAASVFGYALSRGNAKAGGG